MIEKKIFAYEVGGKVVFGDPAKLLRLLWFHSDGQFKELLNQHISADEKVSSPATDKLVQVVCDTFDLPAFDSATGEGTTEGEVLEVLEQFLNWLDTKKKSTAPSPTSTAPTAD